MQNSKKCNYWKDNLKKEQFKNAVKQQMLDGDTFELIDGRNLEMKADIIREIVGSEIDQTKCIVVCVIGPQSTGKSTLMNFCFGTQFLASTGRCTQGIYFTLQKIPTEMKNGSDVEYLIILDTEGLNSPERAEGDRPDSEYDRKIVLFTLLCSDFLIINSSGDMSLQMKELIKICAVRYNELRAYAKVPKILYTFVKNIDNDPLKFQNQIQSLKTDVIESSDEPTIQITADELMEVHENTVKVLGSAFDQKLIERDSAKGILNSTYINTSAPLFGVHASYVWQQVQNFIQSGFHEFRQIGKWLLEAEEHWKLIDRHGANITQFGNVQQMKNDKKIKSFMNQLWDQYLKTHINSKDNYKAQEKCQVLYEKFRDGEDIDSYKKKFIAENQREKDIDFQNFITEKYFRWSKENSQQTITVGAEQKYIKACEVKMDRLKDDYELLIENKFQELKMTLIHTSGISDLYRKARNLCQEIKKIPEADKDFQIKEKFETGWSKLEADISNENRIEQMCKTNAVYLCNTFKSVNNLMVDILPNQFKNILSASKTKEMHPKADLPIKLVQYLVDHISKNAFLEQNKLDTCGQFLFDQSQLPMLKDTKQRIFGLSSDSVKENYLPLQKLLKVDYTYLIIKDFEKALLQSNVFDEILGYLKLKRTFTQTILVKDRWGYIFEKSVKSEEDDMNEMINKLSSLFYDLSKAGFCILRENVKEQFHIIKELLPLKMLDVGKFLKDEKIANNIDQKKKLRDKLRQIIKWDEKNFTSITDRVKLLLCSEEVIIQNQQNPNICLKDHQEINFILKQAMHTFPDPKISYDFSYENSQGKINVKKYFEQKNLDTSTKNYFNCLVNPKEYNMSHQFKWIQLSELASAVVDWHKIVLEIENSVTPQIIFKEKIIQNKDQEIMKFDLQNVLERSSINIGNAELIQNFCLQPIKTQLDEEVRQKLSLYVHPKLIGVITWVACVIIWYKLQKNVLKIFDQEIEKIKVQKNMVFQRFEQIAKGEKTATTSQFAENIFSQTFTKFNDRCLKNFDIKMIDYLQSSEIKEKFDTFNVYQQLDEKYISQAKKNEYQKCIHYVTEPVKVFTTYVNELQLNHIFNKQNQEKVNYQQHVLSNLKILRERLLVIQETMKNYEESKEDSINFFQVFKAGIKIEDQEEKGEIESNMSFILLNTLRKILDGSYIVEQQKLTLTLNDEETEYSLAVKKKDATKKFSGSPLNDLQRLNFEQQKLQDLELLNSFLEKLDLCVTNYKSIENNGKCTDIRFMVGNLIDLIDSKETDINFLSLDDITQGFKTQDEIINYYRANAIGCIEVCKFCNRKCELAPHQDNTINHNCNKLGHQLRIFGGGTLLTSWGEVYPSLTTCDEIKQDTKIRINNASGDSEIRFWSEIHNSRNQNWTTNYAKFLKNGKQNPDWVIMFAKLEKFWKIHGERYCAEKSLKSQNKYIFIEPRSNQIGLKARQMTGSAIVIICLDESKSMFNQNQDFTKAVQGGKELEQYLKVNHTNPEQVQIQLWFNDCVGVNRLYTGQLSSTIPNNLWQRSGCQGDIELQSILNVNTNYGKCGQFTGAVRILNQEVNNQLSQNNYESVYWFFFTDGINAYPSEELDVLQQILKKNRKNWTFQGNQKLYPMIITNQPSIESLCLMKKKIDQIMKEIWQVEDACSLKQNVKTEQLAETMIEQFTFTN